MKSLPLPKLAFKSAQPITGGGVSTPPEAQQSDWMSLSSDEECAVKVGLRMGLPLRLSGGESAVDPRLYVRSDVGCGTLTLCVSRGRGRAAAAADVPAAAADVTDGSASCDNSC